MGRKGFTPIVILFVVLIIVLIAGGFWYYTAHRSAGSQTQPTQTHATSLAPTSSPEAIIYENNHFSGLGTDPYNNAEFVLYNIATQTSTILKSFNASFGKLQGPWTWKTPDHFPIVLSTIYNGTSSASQIEFFDPQNNDVRDITISRSPIINPDTSVGISSAAEEVAYCDENGQFTVLDAGSNTKHVFNQAQACYTGAGAQGPQFSRDGKSLFYMTIPFTEQGYNVGSSSVPWKLNLATGAITSTSLFAFSPISGRISPDQAEYADIEYAGLSIRQLNASVDVPAYNQVTTLNSLKIVKDLTLPQNENIGDVMFTLDGKGVFYYTFASPAGDGLNNIQLGYYDVVAGENYYPLPLPTQPIIFLNLLGATDKDHLVYQATAVPFSGTTSQGGHIVLSAGSSSLYLEGVNTKPIFIDTSVAGFSLKSFISQ